MKSFGSHSAMRTSILSPTVLTLSVCEVSRPFIEGTTKGNARLKSSKKMAAGNLRCKVAVKLLSYGTLF